MSVEIGWLTAHDSDLSECQDSTIHGFNEENLLQEQLDGTISWLLSTDLYLKVRRNSYTKHHRKRYLNIEINGFFLKINHTATTGMYYKCIIYIYMRVEQKVLERGFLCVSLSVCN